MACNNFELDMKSSSATICKNCGCDKIFHEGTYQTNQDKLIEVIAFLESRIEHLRQPIDESELNCLEKEHIKTIESLRMGEAQGIDLCILALKQFVLNIKN